MLSYDILKLEYKEPIKIFVLQLLSWFLSIVKLIVTELNFRKFLWFLTIIYSIVDYWCQVTGYNKQVGFVS